MHFYFFQCNNNANTRGHAYKLYRSQYANSARTNFFANRIVNVWNTLPSTVDFNSLAAFKRTVKRADVSAYLLRNCTWRVLFLLLLCFISYIYATLAQFCAIGLSLFLWTPVTARILALVLQLYERNKLKLKLKPSHFTRHKHTVQSWLLTPAPTRRNCVVASRRVVRIGYKFL